MSALVQIDESFKYAEEAGARMAQLLEMYHPAGYGTSLKVILNYDDGRWHVKGTRYASCD